MPLRDGYDSTRFGCVFDFSQAPIYLPRSDFLSRYPATRTSAKHALSEGNLPDLAGRKLIDTINRERWADSRICACGDLHGPSASAGRYEVTECPPAPAPTESVSPSRSRPRL